MLKALAIPLKKGLSRGVGLGLDWLLPPVCPATGRHVDAHGTVDPEFWAGLRFIRAPFCGRCAMPFAHALGGNGDGAVLCAACLDDPPRFRQARAAMIYDDNSRALILRFKHGDQLQAVRTLAPWMLDAGRDVLAGADIIMPVPLHRWRLLKRRYNQSALLAARLARAEGKVFAVDGLIRTRMTPPQGHLKRGEREANVKGAFRVKTPEAVRGRTVVLVDDVYTTGATLNACADALMAAGAAAVDVIAVARVARDI